MKKQFQSDGFTLSRIDHIGIAVPDLATSLDFYTRILGLNCTAIEEVADQQVKVAFVPLGDSELELLEPTSPDSPVAKFLAAKGPGMHHVAYRVTDLGLALSSLKAQGVRFLDEQPRTGAGGALIAFVHPKASGGVLTELCQRTTAEG
ncbi:MAG: methylmalonyl-CoA epimerase [Peptococcaceae bacterium]|nr:methylmalonyl-CoA epimerase [Peptococcaceae bacterium]